MRCTEIYDGAKENIVKPVQLCSAKLANVQGARVKRCTAVNSTYFFKCAICHSAYHIGLNIHVLQIQSYC